MLTIIQLLSDGADPRLVRCPQPALFMAIASGCSNLVQKIIDHGVNVNEIYFHVLGYFPLDIAISYQATMENLEIIRILLENGADTKHRLPISTYNSTGSLNEGPTLLHVVLEKKCESEAEEEIRRQILELLLNYNCDSIEQFKGRSAIDISMTKGADIFNIFIKHPKVNLNAIINHSNQNILTKMFFLPFFKTFESKQRVEILSNLLRCGADPLNVSQNDETQFENILVFAKKTLDELEHLEIKQNSPPGSKQENKVKKNGKNVDDKGAKQKTLVSDIEDYKQTVELMTDWARLLHIRWLRAKFIKESIKTIIKYKHRHWNMILQEIKHKKSIALWLTPQACLEIWTALKTTNKKVYDDETVLKYLLCVILYCRQHITEKSIVTRISASEKMTIESDVNNFLREYKTAELVPTEQKCASPELGPSFDTKYNVCFECALPLKSDKKLCTLCKNVSFCTTACMKLNINRIDCHPCSDYLRKQYFTNSNDQVYVE
ncbi:unnamed protein product [Parnassius mnemosyne]|uniref:Ankyrin repeat protein n=1 Tax=Parnassius mnemosyne TaxID=213953 RepID=A0AAV1M3S8_9NEOP